MAERNVDLIIRARDDASKAFDSVNKALNDLAAAQKAAASGAADVSRSLGAAEGDVKGLAAALANTSKQAGQQAETAYKRVAAAVDTARAAFDRQKRDITESRASFTALQRQLEAAGRAVEIFRTRNEAALDGRFKEQLKAAEQGYRALERQVAKSGASLANQERAFEESADNLNRLEAAASAAEAGLRSLQQTQARLSSRTSAEEQARLAQAFREAAVAGKISTQEQERLAASFRQAAAAATAMRPPLRQVVQDLLFMGPAAGVAADGLRRGAGEALNMRRALAAFYGDSRRALSLMQRLRGEVLSLTASFVGFYGVFRAGNSFLEAFNQVQAAQNRLSAAFGQDAQRVQGELAFLNAEATRLGIQFGVLSQEYSKFVISGQQAGIETDKLRTIFRQVTEAGRVLRLSNEQISGTLTALSQIAGKGTLQMEELRQQLGDRLPGAVGLVASSLGFATDELDQFYKAVENGQIGAEEALVALGQGLEKAYGDQLPQALDTVATKIGSLQNLLFQRQLSAANSGFIEGLENALEALNGFLASDEGIRFFENLGAAFGQVFNLLPGIIENVDKLVTAFQAFVAIKVSQVVAGLAGNFARIVAPTEATRQAVLRFNAALYAVSPAAASAMLATTRLGFAMRGLRTVALGTATALRAVFASLGGPIGIAVAALTYFAFDRVVGADEKVQEFNDTIRDHEEALDKIQTAYRRAAEGAGDWREEIENLTLVEVEANLARLRRQLTEFRNDPNNTFNSAAGDAQDRRTALQAAARTMDELDLVNNLLDQEKALNLGKITAQEFLEVIEDFRDATGDMIDPELLESLVKTTRAQADLEKAIAEGEAQVRLFTDTATEADKAILGLGAAAEKAADSGQSLARTYEAFEEALRELAKNIPGLKAEIDRFDSIAKIEAQFQGALAAARALPDEILRVAAAQEALSTRNQALDAIEVGQLPGDFSSADGGVAAARALIMQKEGFRSTPYNDPRTDANGNQIGPNIYRAGFGSDTITLADGSIQKVVQGMSVSMEDALRDLDRRITQEFMPRARSQVGAARFDSFTPQQQGVLTSIAYNYGELPGRILDALRTGTNEQIANAIRGLAGDNGGVNAGRRNQEAAVFAQGVGTDVALANAERQLELEQDFLKNVEERLEQQRFELSIQDQALQDREVAKALREAELEAQKAGVELTAQQRADIEAVTREKFAQQAADEARNAKLEEARRIEEQITLLQERRRFLLERRDTLEGNGDLVAAANVQEELDTVEARLGDTIAKAQEFWRALGGEGSEAALQNLEFAKEELNNIERQVVTTGKQMNDFFADTATAAIDRFAERVANGENALQAFAEEFRRMAAEIILQIAQMIIRQAIFNAISGGSPGGQGGAGGFVSGLVNGLFHGGGIAGGASQTRTVNPALMANAIRYHTGGIAGLRPDEVPAILKEGEEVLTEGDPRHRFNGGAGGGKPEVTVINAVDGTDALEQALSNPRGGEMVVNYMRRNADRINAALGR